MTGRRRELTESFSLLAGDERWLVTDAVVGTLALVVWVAGTGAVGLAVADATGLATPTGPDGAWTLATLSAVALLWLVVPAAAAVWRVRSRVLNIRGNVERFYRFDNPGTLLAPPLVVLFVLGIWAVALGPGGWPLFVAAVPVSLAFLVRTLAYSLRVYAVSRPAVPQAGIAVSVAVQMAGVLAFAGARSTYQSAVTGAFETAGLPPGLLGSVTVLGASVPLTLGAAVGVPVAVGAAYLAVQVAGAALVRTFEPSVARSEMRTGQRYPPHVDAGTAVRNATSQSSSRSPTPSDADEGTPTVDAAAATGDDDDQDLDDVSNTRVFTPPEEDVDPDLDADPDAAPTAVGGAGADADPQANGDTPDPEAAESQTRHCDDCDRTFVADTAMRFCPNCGAPLEGSATRE